MIKNYILFLFYLAFFAFLSNAQNCLQEVDIIPFNSDDYFHGYSIQQITSFIDNAGINCATTIPTGNTPPTVTVGEDGFYIPISTPFELTAAADDIDGDLLTYCWEQLDAAFESFPLGSPEGNAPLFRTYQPTTSTTRVFPQLQKIVNNNRPVRFNC